MKFVVIALVAAGIGGLYAVGTFVYGQIAKSRSLQRLPEVARGLGLSVGERGDIEGELRGHRVSVRPQAASFSVNLSAEPDFFVTTIRRYAGRVPDLPAFDSGDGSFDRAFPLRRASPDVAQRLAHDAALRERLVAFASWKRPRLASVTIRPGGGISGWSAEGGPWEKHLPAEHLETVLSEAVGIAELIEQRLR